MSARANSGHRAWKPSSIRKQVNRRILAFSILIGVLAALVTFSVILATQQPALRRWKSVNLRALAEINCTSATCETSAFLTDSQADSPDYIIDLQSRFFIDTPNLSPENPGHFGPLDYSDTAFISQFRQPASYTTPDGEVWRLYARDITVGSKALGVIIGYAEKAPWRMLDALPSQTALIDATLKREADRIAASLPDEIAAVHGPRSVLSADGFEVVDFGTKQITNSAFWIPSFLPRNVTTPAAGWQFYVHNDDLNFVQTDTNGRVLAVSLVPVGSLQWIIGCCLFAAIITGVLAHALSRRFLRRYFAVTAARVPTLEEALRAEEGQSIEFKRGISADGTKASNVEDEVLKSIAAFANTNDGVIFIGVDDAGHVKGLDFDSKQKDRMATRMYQLVRHHIRPAPVIDISFEDFRGLIVARILVPRGEAPIYMLGGVIYVRYGSSDGQAQPEDLKRLVSQFAF